MILIDSVGFNESKTNFVGFLNIFRRAPTVENQKCCPSILIRTSDTVKTPGEPRVSCLVKLFLRSDA